MTDARQFAVEFFRKWQAELNFVVPTEMVADLEGRVRGLREPLPDMDRMTNLPVMLFGRPVFVDKSLDGDPVDPLYIMPFDGSTGTPPSGQAGLKSTEGANL